MSFTSDVKKEIVNRGLTATDDVSGAKRAAISAFVRTSGAVGVVNGAPNFFLVSETENVAGFFMQLFSETFETELFVTHATMDRKSGRDKLVMQCSPAFAQRAMTALGLLKRGGGGLREGISKTLVNTDEKKLAYIRGAFLGGGSCTLPTKADSATSYHLEIVFSEKRTAQDFCDLLASLELFAKLTVRKETYVAYIKSKEAISDFLSVIGAENALRKFGAFLEKRDEANRDNRARNCMAGNADKSAIASVKQVVAIKKLEERTGFAELSEELRTLAKARLEYPALSLRELAAKLNTSKSCLNHRMRRLMELSEEI